MGSQVLSLKYDLDADMATLFGSETWDLCWEVGWAKKLDPTLNTSPCDYFLYSYIFLVSYIMGIQAKVIK